MAPSKLVYSQCVSRQRTSKKHEHCARNRNHDAIEKRPPKRRRLHVTPCKHEILQSEVQRPHDPMLPTACGYDEHPEKWKNRCRSHKKQDCILQCANRRLTNEAKPIFGNNTSLQQRSLRLQIAGKHAFIRL